MAVIDKRVYFCASRMRPKVYNTTKNKVLNFDSRMLYQGYNKDFGPLNIGYISYYCQEIKDHLR